MSAVGLTLRRIAGYAVDVVLLAAVLLPVAFGTALLLGTAGVDGLTIWLRSLIFVSVPAWTYFVVLERRRGATVAKRLLGLRTVGAAGSPPGWAAAVTRTAVKLLPWELVHVAFFALARDFSSLGSLQIAIGAVAYALMLALAVVPLWTGGHRSLHDLASKTRVVAG